MVKVLAINSSPQMNKGNTALILDPFLKGMKEKGAEIETLYTQKLNIKPCTACFNCWFPTDGECSIRDDMDDVLPKIAEADIMVVASPLYVDGITGPMKNLIDRMLPLLEPFVELRNGRCRHPPRKHLKPGKIVYLATCAWWKLENFDPMILYMKAMCANMGREFVGALLRPHSEAMKYLKRTGNSVDDIINVAKKAGRELVENGKISGENLKIISRELVPLNEYIQFFNQGMENAVKSARKK
ncbi:MAG: flavodoxin family protein [Candidatus Hodarchaeota archaeon]